MKYCQSCKMKLADQEPFCPLCGPDSNIDVIPVVYNRTAYPESPKTIKLKFHSLTIYDKHIFTILTIVAAVFTLGMLFIDYMVQGGWTWSRYTTAAFLFIWTSLILPYAFNQIRGDHYLLLFTTALSALLCFIDLQDAALTWAYIPSALFFIPATVNCLIFSIKGS